MARTTACATTNICNLMMISRSVCQDVTSDLKLFFATEFHGHKLINDTVTYNKIVMVMWIETGNNYTGF